MECDRCTQRTDPETHHEYTDAQGTVYYCALCWEFMQAPERAFD